MSSVKSFGLRGRIRSFAVAVLALALPVVAGAAAITSPSDYSTVDLLSPRLKTYNTAASTYQVATYKTKNTDARKALMADVKTNALPVVLGWTGLSGACSVRVYRVRDGENAAPVFAKDGVTASSVAFDYAEVGRNYRWTVTSGATTLTGHFFTRLAAPRIFRQIDNYGSPQHNYLLGNCRDLGGWTNTAGKVVRQGLFFRCEEWDFMDGVKDDSGVEHLIYDKYDQRYAPDAKWFWCETMGVALDIDLRAKADVLKSYMPDPAYEPGADIHSSPISYDLVNHPVRRFYCDDLMGSGFPSYQNLNSSVANRQAFYHTFTNFVASARTGRALVFHCAQGKDRTGSLAYVVNGLLGVPRRDLDLDWVYSWAEDSSITLDSTWSIDLVGNNVLNAYAGATLAEKCAAYVTKCYTDAGQTSAKAAADIAEFRALMLEEPETPVQPAVVITVPVPKFVRADNTSKVETSVEYSGESRRSKVTVIPQDNPYFTVNWGTGNWTDVGTYTVTVSLLDTTHYKWADGTTAAKKFTYKITRTNNSIYACPGFTSWVKGEKVGKYYPSSVKFDEDKMQVWVEGYDNPKVRYTKEQVLNDELPPGKYKNVHYIPTCNNYTFASNVVPFVVLPANETPAYLYEYVDMNNKAMADTGFVPHLRNTYVECTYALTDLNDAAYGHFVAGHSGSLQFRIFRASNSTNSGRLTYKNGYAADGLVLCERASEAIGAKHTVRVGNRYAWFDGASKGQGSYNPTNGDSDDNLWLFCCEHGAPLYHSRARYYEFKIFASSTATEPIHDYVPCKTRQTQLPALYDKVTKKLLPFTGWVEANSKAGITRAVALGGTATPVAAPTAETVTRPSVAPAAGATVLTNGQQQKPVVSPSMSLAYSAGWGATDWKTAGTHTLTFTLNEGYAWTDGSTDPFVCTYTFVDPTVARPTVTPASGATITVDGGVHKPTVAPAASDGFTVSYGSTDWKTAGSHTLTITLKPGYTWSDKRTDAIVCTYTFQNPPTHEHAFGAWETLSVASKEQAGRRVRRCECGEIEEQIVPQFWDYLVTDDAGYFLLTDYCPMMTATRVDMTVRFLNDACSGLFSASEFTTGNPSGSYAGTFNFQRDDNRFDYYNAALGSNITFTNTFASVGKTHRYVIEGGAVTVDGQEIANREQASVDRAHGPLALLATKFEGHSDFTWVSPRLVYAIQISENGEMKYDLRPATNELGHATLYDGVSGQFLEPRKLTAKTAFAFAVGNDEEELTNVDRPSVRPAADTVIDVTGAEQRPTVSPATSDAFTVDYGATDWKSVGTHTLTISLNPGYQWSDTQSREPIVCAYVFQPHVHAYGAWETVTPATKDGDGRRVRHCACGATEEQIVPQLWDYLATDDTGYFLLNDYYPHLVRTKIELKVQFLGDMSGSSLFTASSATAGRNDWKTYFTCQIWSDNIEYANSVCGGLEFTQSLGDLTRAHVYSFEGKNVTVDGIELKSGSSTTDKRADGPLALLATHLANEGGFEHITPRKVYSIRITEGGELKYDLRPAKTAGAATLYDSVSGAFLTPTAAKTFTVGNDSGEPTVVDVARPAVTPASGTRVDVTGAEQKPTVEPATSEGFTVDYGATDWTSPGVHTLTVTPNVGYQWGDTQDIEPMVFTYEFVTHEHRFGEWEITPPTKDGDGRRVRRCACGETEEQALPQLWDYLLTDDTGYFLLTDYYPHLKNTQVDMTLTFVGTYVWSSLFTASGLTAGGNDFGNAMSFQTWNTTFEYYNSAGFGSYEPAAPFEADRRVTFSVLGSMVTIDGTPWTKAGVTMQDKRASGPLALLATHMGDGKFEHITPRKVYSVKIVEGGVLKYDLRPAKTAAGAATLYDNVSGTFLAPTAAKSFSVGNDEVAPGLPWSGKKVSIVGDSYSAFKDAYGCTKPFYPHVSDDDDDDVTRVEQMWWHKAITALGGTILTNRAVSGARMSSGMLPAVSGGQLGRPDVILIHGGLNDSWGGVAEEAFVDGVEQLFDCLDTQYASAKKYVILPRLNLGLDTDDPGDWVDYGWGARHLYRQALKKRARAHAYAVIDLNGWFGTESGDYNNPMWSHPKEQGMTKIANRVVDFVTHENDAAPSVYAALRTAGGASSKGAYFVTDYVPDLARTRIEFKARFNDLTTQSSGFLVANGHTSGLAASAPSFQFVHMYGKNGQRTPYAAYTAGGVDVQDRGFEDTASEHVFVIEGDRMTRDGQLVASGEGVNAPVRTAGPLVIGAMENGALNYYNFAKMDLAYCRVWEAQPNGSYELVHNYLPARDGDGVVALYDTVDRLLIAAKLAGGTASVVGSPITAVTPAAVSADRTVWLGTSGEFATEESWTANVPSGVRSGEFPLLSTNAVTLAGTTELEASTLRFGRQSETAFSGEGGVTNAVTGDYLLLGPDATLVARDDAALRFMVADGSKKAASAVLGDGAKLVAENGGTIMFDGAFAADAGNVTLEARGTAAGSTSKVRYVPFDNLAAGNTNVVLKAVGNAQVIVAELRKDGDTWNPGKGLSGVMPTVTVIERDGGAVNCSSIYVEGARLKVDAENGALISFDGLPNLAAGSDIRLSNTTVRAAWGEMNFGANAMTIALCGDTPKATVYPYDDAGIAQLSLRQKLTVTLAPTPAWSATEGRFVQPNAAHGKTLVEAGVKFVVDVSALAGQAGSKTFRIVESHPTSASSTTIAVPAAGNVTVTGAGAEAASVAFALAEGGKCLDLTVSFPEQALPTVDGKPVAIADVFKAARVRKPIDYPTAPTLNVNVTPNTIVFDGETVSIPAYYTATLTGTRVTLVLSEAARPVIASEDGHEALVVTDDAVSIHVANPYAQLFYTLQRTDDLKVPDWADVETKSGVPVDFTVNRSGAAAFYRVSADDEPKE